MPLALTVDMIVINNLHNEIISRNKYSGKSLI